MATPLFPRWTNTVARLTVGIALALPAIAIAGFMLYVRTPYGTSQAHPVEQPVQFDHRHHVADVGIDCRYCHTTVETGPVAGYPSTYVCMGCHSQIWNRSPLLDTVRGHYFTDTPIPWKRVYNLPDYVYFNHALHVTKGVGCVTCHGAVDRMPAVAQEAPLTMGWCLGCHRDPAPNLRPLDQITSTTWQPDPADPGLGARLVKAHNVQTRTSCTTCHR